MKSIDMLLNYLTKNGFKTNYLNLGTPKKGFVIATSQDSPGSFVLSSTRASYPHSTSAIREITSNKTISYDLADYHDIPYPKTTIIDPNDSSSTKRAVHFMNEYGPVIIKPSSGHGSCGLSLNITKIEELKKAIVIASKHSKDVLIQQQVDGEEYRFIFIKGKVVEVLLRQKPHVVGDGKSSVAELIQAENRSRSSIYSLVEYPLLTEEIIDKHHLRSGYVPLKDEYYEISKATMIRNGASVYRKSSQVHSSYKAAAKKLISSLGLDMVCVDLMLKTPKDAANHSNYNLIEINTGMSLPMCYSCRDGNHFNIIEDYLGPLLIESLRKNDVWVKR